MIHRITAGTGWAHRSSDKAPSSLQQLAKAVERESSDRGILLRQPRLRLTTAAWMSLRGAEPLPGWDHK
jgi:hypothetical protein